MKKFLIFSKSYWNETPRLRHQVALLLLDHGNQVVFFEKPDFNFRRSKTKPMIIESTATDIRRTKQLVHHQLRIFSLIRYLNAEYEKKSIKNSINVKKESNSIIINFNYDYYFLRDLFPENKIISIINDDFVAQAKVISGRHVLSSLEITCKKSDAVFVVSYPLARQVENWCEPQIFFPWAQSRYIKPDNLCKRDSILIWAHINDRLDFDLIRKFAVRRENYKIDVFGPISPNIKEIVECINGTFKQVRFYGSRDLQAINFDKYFCSVMPYRPSAPGVGATSAANKTFYLLSMGMPLIAHGMPDFINNRSIFKTSNLSDFIEAADFCFARFQSLQNDIEELVNCNQAKDRYDQIMTIVEKNDL